MKPPPAVFPGRLGLQQRVLPLYRVPFFDRLAESCAGGLGLFAGRARPAERIAAGRPAAARWTEAGNLHLFGGPFYLCYQRGIIEWLEAWDPQALIVEANPRYLSTPAAVRWMRARGRRVVGWGLGSPSAGPARMRRRRAFLDQFDALIAYSRRGAQEYAALGFPRERIFTAFNAAAPAPPGRFDRRPTNDRPAVLFVGRLQARKRVDHLLRACAGIRPSPRLIIVGDGPQRARLEALARRVYPSAEFAGEQHGPALEAFFEQADLFVLPGTGGLAVQQAMSHGLPVIVAQGDGTQDDLVRAGNGWQVPPGDYAGLAAALGAALSDPARLRSLGEESRRIVSEEINIDRMAQVFIEALNRAGR